MSKITTPPQRLEDEAPRTFRLRAVYWIICTHAGMAYDEIVQTFNDIYSPQRTTKESIVRDLKTLQKRGEIDAVQDPEDGRRWVWTITA
jgi:hypothetical protein